MHEEEQEGRGGAEAGEGKGGRERGGGEGRVERREVKEVEWGREGIRGHDRLVEGGNIRDEV